MVKVKKLLIVSAYIVFVLQAAFAEESTIVDRLLHMNITEESEYRSLIESGYLLYFVDIGVETPGYPDELEGNPFASRSLIEHYTIPRNEGVSTAMLYKNNFISRRTLYRNFGYPELVEQIDQHWWNDFGQFVGFIGIGSGILGIGMSYLIVEGFTAVGSSFGTANNSSTGSFDYTGIFTTFGAISITGLAIVIFTILTEPEPVEHLTEDEILNMMLQYNEEFVFYGGK